MAIIDGVTVTDTAPAYFIGRYVAEDEEPAHFYHIDKAQVYNYETQQWDTFYEKSNWHDFTDNWSDFYSRQRLPRA